MQANHRRSADPIDASASSAQVSAREGPGSVSTLTVTRVQRARYALTDDEGRQLALLWVRPDVGRGEIRTEHGTWTVRRHGWRRVTAGDVDHPLVRLDPDGALVPGASTAARWTVRRLWRVYKGTLASADRSITLRLAPFSGRSCEVEIGGQWEQRDLVVLTACFGLLARRRRDIIIMVTAGH